MQLTILIHSLGDVINEWRDKLDLEPIAFSDGPNLAETLKIPFTYCWSPALVPKPGDWGAHIGKSDHTFTLYQFLTRCRCLRLLLSRASELFAATGTSRIHPERTTPDIHWLWKHRP